MLTQTVNFNTCDHAYHVINGSKSSSYHTGSMTITAGTAYGLYAANNREQTPSWGVNYFTGGTGGRIGLLNPSGGNTCPVSNFTLQSYDTATSAFDITEATEDFSTDGSSFANDNSTNLASDSNGNQTFDGTQVYTYDAWNRLITVSHGYRDSSNNVQHGQPAVTCSYDAKGRRISKTVANTGSWDCTYNYYHKGDSVTEAQDGSAETIKQFVWGLQYIDELVQTSLNSSPTTQSNCDTPYWAEQDANWNVLGIVDSTGELTERYEYSAYGTRTPYTSAGSNDPFCTAATTASERFNSVDTTEPWGLCEVGHQGLMHDEEGKLVYSRTRQLSVALNRFVTRDLAHYPDGLNSYEYVKNDPVDLDDPFGTISSPKLSFVTINAPVAGFCGRIGNWDTQWRLNVKSTKGGYVIQHVTETASVVDCQGANVNVGADSFGYWEAWAVRPGSNRTTWLLGAFGSLKNVDDSFNPGFQQNCTKGSIILKGDAEFYEGLELPDFFALVPGSPAGALPIVYTDPGVLSGGTGGTTKKLTVTWDCCASSWAMTKVTYGN